MKITKILVALLVALGLMAPATAATAASTAAASQTVTASATVLSAPKSIAPTSSWFHRLNAVIKGRLSVTACEFWNLPKGDNTHAGCPEGSRVLRLRPGDSTKRHGWEDADGVCAPKGYMVQRQTTVGTWRPVIKNYSRRLICQKVSPNILYGGKTAHFRRVKLLAGK